MLIVNLNIRGLGGGTKARYLRSIIGREEAEFVCLQETKTSELSDARCYNLWGTTKLAGFTIKEIMEVVVFCLCGILNPLLMRVM